MSRNLILIITIFGFWLFIYLSNVKEEQNKNQKEDFIDGLADDGIKFTNNQVTYSNSVIGPRIPTTEKSDYNNDGVKMYNTPIYIFSPVKSKGEA